MKYSSEFYTQTAFYSPDEEMSNYQQRVIKTRKDHKCCNCQENIKQGEMAVLETCFIDEAPKSAYTCTDCCDKFLDQIYEVKEAAPNE